MIIATDATCLWTTPGVTRSSLSHILSFVTPDPCSPFISYLALGCATHPPAHLVSVGLRWLELAQKMLLDLRVASRNWHTAWPRSSARGRASCLRNHWCASKQLAQRSCSHSKHQKSAGSLQRVQTACASTICWYTDRRRCRLSKKMLSRTGPSAPGGRDAWQIGHCMSGACRHPEHSVCRQSSSLGHFASAWQPWQRRNWNSSVVCWGTRGEGWDLKSQESPPTTIIGHLPSWLEAGLGLHISFQAVTGWWKPRLTSISISHLLRPSHSNSTIYWASTSH